MNRLGTRRRLPSHLDWQPIRWIPVGAVVEVCDDRGFIRDAVLARVGAPLQVFGGSLEGEPTHWRWRFDGRQDATADLAANRPAPAREPKTASDR